VDGVRVCGLLLQAGPASGAAVAPSLLQWGSDKGGYGGNAANPGFMQVRQRLY
jgi:hypothetical protein